MNKEILWDDLPLHEGESIRVVGSDRDTMYTFKILAEDEDGEYAVFRDEFARNGVWIRKSLHYHFYEIGPRVEMKRVPWDTLRFHEEEEFLVVGKEMYKVMRFACATEDHRGVECALFHNGKYAFRTTIYDKYLYYAVTNEK